MCCFLLFQLWHNNVHEFYREHWWLWLSHWKILGREHHFLYHYRFQKVRIISRDFSMHEYKNWINHWNHPSIFSSTFFNSVWKLPQNVDLDLLMFMSGAKKLQINLNHLRPPALDINHLNSFKMYIFPHWHSIYLIYLQLLHAFRNGG